MPAFLEMPCEEPSADLDVYLIGFVQRDPQLIEKFVSIAEPYLLSIARRFAADLPCDLHMEVVGQAYLKLLDKTGKKFDPRRGAAKEFLFDVVRNATLQVRAQYCPPGQPTRTRKPRSQKLQGDFQRKQVTCVSVSEIEGLTASRNTAYEIMARYDAGEILGKAPQSIATALYRIHFTGEILGEVARHVGVNRFKLKRLVNAYSLKLRQV